MRPERLPWLGVRASSRAGVRLMLDTDRRLATRLFAVSVLEGLLPTAFTVLGGRLVAAAEGAEADADALLAQLDSDHAELSSSMRRDVAAGREPELDAIAGAVLRAAGRHGLPCPTIAALAGRVAERAGVPAPVA